MSLSRPLRAASDESRVDPFLAALRSFGWPVDVLKAKNCGSHILIAFVEMVAHTKGMENKIMCL